MAAPASRLSSICSTAATTTETDWRTVLKALIAFWLLAATDGHAKNFSVFLAPGGRFGLTPLYDVISAQPSADAGKIQRNQMKLAMAVGKKPHYAIDTVAPRHFVQTAAKAGVGAITVQTLLDELAAKAPAAVEKVMSTLPHEFRTQIAESILKGFVGRLRHIGDETR